MITKGRPVVIAGYDPTWPAVFREESRRLAELFPDTPAVIEHIGSTAVPGLPCAPIVDIMLGVEKLEEVEDRIPAIEEIGYVFVPKHEPILPSRRFFEKGLEGPRRHHLHVVEVGGEFWQKQIEFRELLRGSPRVAAAYFGLKLELAGRFRAKQRDYRCSKFSFIEGALAAVRKRRERGDT